MAIHWFPGHMATSKREIRAALPQVDLVIEVLDARIPASSENPLMASLRGEKPTVLILNKSDLADPAVTDAWLAASNARPGVRALALSLVAQHHRRPQFARELIDLAHQLVAPSRVASRPMVAMIVGIPNVGKSTLINTLAGRTIAATGNKPGVTRLQQRVRVGSDLELLDTPGLLWPKLDPPARGYRLALTGAVTDRVVEYQDLAEFLARFLLARYPDGLRARYGLDPLPDSPEALMEAIGRRRGFLVKGGGIDPQRTAERLVHDLQDGALGRISLDPPPSPPSPSPASP
ncbi:MAG: ribosome biogenesis GTPase YlqF [Myxococcota bacterium]